MFVLAAASVIGLGACCAVALRARRALTLWHTGEARHFELLLGELERTQEAVRYTWSVVHRPRLVRGAP